MQGAQIHYFATSFVSLLTGISLYKAISSHLKQSSHRSQIKQIQRTQIVSPSDKLPLNQTVILQGQVQYNPNDPRNKQIVKSQKGKNKEYVLHLGYRQPIYSNDDFESRAEYIINLKNVLPKAIIDYNPSFYLKGKNSKVLLKNYDQVPYEKALEITKWQNNKRRLNFTEKFQILIYSYFRSIGSLIFRDKRANVINGLHIGDREVECGIQLGGSIMALGTVGITTQGIVFIQPQFLFRDRLSFVGYLQDLIEALESKRNVWGLIGIIGLIYLGRRAYNYNKKHQVILQIKNRYHARYGKAN